MQNLPRLSLTFSAGQAYALTAQCPSGGMDAIAPWLLKFSSITLLKYKLGQNFLKIPTIIHLNEKKKKKFTPLLLSNATCTSFKQRDII